MNNLSNKYYIRYFSIFFGLLFLLGFIFLIARVQRGYSAIILSISAILLFVYWSDEIKKNMRNLPYLGVLNKQKKFGYQPKDIFKKKRVKVLQFKDLVKKYNITGIKYFIKHNFFAKSR